MPGPTIGTADRTSNPLRRQHRLVDELYLRRETILMQPWEGIGSHSVIVNRANFGRFTLGASFFVPIDPQPAAGESFGAAPANQAENAWNSLSPVQEFRLKKFTHRIYVSRFIEDQYGDPNDQWRLQLESAWTPLYHEYFRVFFNGVGGGQNDREFLGLDALCTGTQRLTGDPTDIPASIDGGLARLNSGPPGLAGIRAAIIMNTPTSAIFTTQLRAAGVPVEPCPHPRLSWWWCYRGIPVLVDDLIPEVTAPMPPTYNTNVYLVIFGRDADGVYGIFNNRVGRNGIVIRQGLLDPARDAQFTEVSANWSMVLPSRSCAVAVTFTGLTTPTILT